MGAFALVDDCGEVVLVGRETTEVGIVVIDGPVVLPGIKLLPTGGDQYELKTSGSHRQHSHLSITCITPF
jgi:hypothetical protein